MDESGKTPRIEVQDIDHLGIVAGIIDEAGLVEEIDRRIGTHPQEHVSSGRAVKAMILNDLGFLSAPLYLFEELFSGKATEHLIGPGIEPEHLNDDRLGRVLERGLLACKVSFACRADAEEAIEAFAGERLGKHHRLSEDPPPEIVEEAHYEKPGRPAKGAEPEEVRYRVVKVEVERDEVDGADQISNLTEERRSVLSFLGQSCRRYHLLS